jgi:hypothetical protein
MLLDHSQVSLAGHLQSPLATSETKEPKDRRFVSWRCATSHPAKALVAEAMKQVEVYERKSGARVRRRRPTDQITFGRTVDALVCDAMHHALTGSLNRISVSLSKANLSALEVRYDRHDLGRALPKALNVLAVLGWLHLEKGRRGQHFVPGRLSSFVAGPVLTKRMHVARLRLDDMGLRTGAETIVLKKARRREDRKADRLTYKDNGFTNLARKNLDRINESIRDASIEFDDSVETRHPVDTGKRTLFRYFSRTFDEGGRLFGGWWLDLSRDSRDQGLLLDGEEIATLDFRQMAPRSLYALAQKEAPSTDAYAIPGLEHGERDGVKMVLNALFFQDGIPCKFPRGTRRYFLRRHFKSFSQVVDAIAAHHPNIADYLGTGIGYRLMFLESEVMVEVLLRLLDRGITALPIHDAVMVPWSRREEARLVMASTYRDTLEQDIEVSLEGGSYEGLCPDLHTNGYALTL